MPKVDSRVDTYIAGSAEFAQPILRRLRKLVHAACPDVEEAIKWQFPTFSHKGMLCSMAAFKAHCTFGFWKHNLMVGKDSASLQKADEAMGLLGRITSLSDLPPDELLLSHISKAVRLNELGIKVPRTIKPRQKVKLIIPPLLMGALKKDKKAAKNFENLSPSHQREYVEWISEAKREETRAKRLATTLAWLSEGKSLNWKYAKC
ncbi:MAG: YdeI/OmpD-associated family protein [Verrucomicrobiota bacterium]